MGNKILFDVISSFCEDCYKGFKWNGDLLVRIPKGIWEDEFIVLHNAEYIPFDSRYTILGFHHPYLRPGYDIRGYKTNPDIKNNDYKTGYHPLVHYEKKDFLGF